jgi:hypothetical protein
MNVWTESSTRRAMRVRARLVVPAQMVDATLACGSSCLTRWHYPLYGRVLCTWLDEEFVFSRQTFLNVLRARACAGEFRQGGVMHLTHKVNAGVVLVLAALFYQAFMFPKHDAVLSMIIPFGDDPYDAVGSFAMIVGMMVAFLSLGRAFRPYRLNSASIETQVYLVRAQTYVVLAVVSTLVSDAVALARHPFMWATAPERNELLALLGGMAILVTAVEVLIRHSTRDLIPTGARPGRTRAVVVGLAGVLILAVYPEHMIQGIATHLLTVVAGALILFATMRSLLTVLVPYETNTAEREATDEQPGFGRMRRWGIVLLVGFLLGVLLFVGETSEGTGRMSLGQTVFVATVFAGLSTVGLATAYAFLGTPLGLGPRS